MRRRIRTLSLQLWAIAVMLVKTFPKNVSSVWFLGAYDTSSAGKNNIHGKYRHQETRCKENIRGFPFKTIKVTAEIYKRFI